MKEVSRVSIDISKQVFQVHAASSKGEILWRKRVRREDLHNLIKELSPCEIGMEACGGAHFWGREFQALGHMVRLLAPQYVKPYVKRNKNDSADADAILEAMSRPTMSFIPVKSAEQQEVCQLHRARELAVKHRTALVNEIKGFMHEHGIALSCSGYSKLMSEYLSVLEQCGSRLRDGTKRLMSTLFEQLFAINKMIEKYELELKAHHAINEISQRLESVPGVGLLTATAIAASVGDPSRYKSGRDFAASLGLVPRQHSSGATQRLGGISKRGDSYLRKLMVQGGHTVVMHAKKHQDSRSRWVVGIAERRGRVKAAVAVANKNARVMWALMVKGGSYQENYGEKNQREVEPSALAL